MFQAKLLDWYQANHRKLPWRENHNPYYIWLSEVMLQQTQVATVIDYFNRFIEAYPSVEALAQADEDHVLKLWEGLGYYSRARRLIPCARMVVEDFDGQFPQTYKDLLALPGVGSYTAGAIGSIAFNKKYPAVDGNVMRVYSRLFVMSHDLSQAKSKKAFEDKVLETLPEDRRHFNQALMELGATICSPKSPKCDQCPLVVDCQAYQAGRVEDLPVKTKKIKKKTLMMAVCQVVYEDLWMVEKRGDQGLLAGMWGFPAYSYDKDPIKAIQEGLKDNYGLEPLDFDVIKEGKHVFTHRIWHMTLYRVRVKKRVDTDLPMNQWIRPEDIQDYPLPTAFKKLL